MMGDSRLTEADRLRQITDAGFGIGMRAARDTRRSRVGSAMALSTVANDSASATVIT